MGFDTVSILTIAGITFVSLLTIGLILARLYRRASKELSFVRTGFRGQKVIMNGGALVLPVLHEIIPVNMNTLRLEVRRAHEHALITKDRMRVDVVAEFFVRVQPSTESIANAAQTLGRRTMQPELLKELIEGKFVDALRSVAAEMEMRSLHEQRVEFVQKVQHVVSEDLLKNGLELESVSLTGLDQTGKEYFNPDNAFDAEGLTKLTEVIEARRKQRNDIEQETEVNIRSKNLEAERQRLEISKEEEYARLQQEREVSIRRAAQMAEIAAQQAAKRKESEQAEINANQQIEQSRIASERIVEEERIEKERLLEEKEIGKNRAIEEANIVRARAIELSEQDKAIAIAEKSREESDAAALAAEARAKSVKAEELVITVREVEQAEREKQKTLVEARKEAEQQAIGIKVSAEAEKQAADDHAEAVRIRAQAEADQERISAEAKAQAVKLEAEAAAEKYRVDAEGKKAIHEADNLLSAAQIEMQLKMSLMRHLPDIIRESVRPMENIDGIKIIQVDGLSGAGASAPANDGSVTSNSLADQVVNSALRYKAQAPLVDSLMKEVGLDGTNINGLTEGLTSAKEEA